MVSAPSILKHHLRVVVEHMFDGKQMTLRVTGAADALGEVVAQKSINLFVGSTLPG